MKLKRGVGMCGIGRYLVTVSCGSSHGPTDAPLTTAKPCVDKYTNCAELARDNCYSNGEMCTKSCGLCEGMTPHKSNTCYNLWSNCNELTGYCHQARVKKHCKKSCKACDGDTMNQHHLPVQIIGTTVVRMPLTTVLDGPKVARKPVENAELLWHQLENLCNLFNFLI